MRELRVDGGSVTSTRQQRVGRTRNWPANLGWARHGWSGRRCGLALRLGNRTWWFSVRPR
ncbi:hypothetical protein [Micromonospora sp. NPDC004551]|uniref:hypothetical protein n=1 Tax=Micromonospora sp. NPDC004551 TaxID=3154284 RepID=UPI00339E55EC